MTHYVQGMVDSVTESLTDQEIAFFYRWKRRLDEGEFSLNAGKESKINALDLLWQNYAKYDQLGHAILAFQLWFGVVTHPQVRSTAIRVGTVPWGDKAVKENNKALSDLGSLYKATVWGGNFEEDGAVYPQLGSPYENRRSIPLEIGSVSPASLAHEFRLYRCFARWPYDSKYLYVFDIPGLTASDDFSLIPLVHSHWDLCEDCKEDSWFKKFPFLLPKSGKLV